MLIFTYSAQRDVIFKKRDIEISTVREIMRRKLRHFEFSFSSYSYDTLPTHKWPTQGPYEISHIYLDSARRALSICINTSGNMLLKKISFLNQNRLGPFRPHIK